MPSFHAHKRPRTESSKPRNFRKLVIDTAVNHGPRILAHGLKTAGKIAYNRWLGGKTTTRTKHYTTNVAPSVHNDLSVSGVNLFVGKNHKKSKKTGGNFVYVHQFCTGTGYQGGATQNNVGHQGLYLGQAMCSQQQLVGVGSSNINGYTTWSQNAFDLNPNEASTGGITIGAVTAPTSDYVHLTRAVGRHVFLNSSNVSSQVQVLWCLCKRDSPIHPLLAWTAAMAAKRMGQVASANPTAIGVTSATAGYANPDTYGEHPTMHKEWQALWRVLKTSSFVLEPGAQKAIGTSITWNATFGRSEISDRNVQYLAGITVIPVIIIRPSIVMQFATAGVVNAAGTYTTLPSGATSPTIGVADIQLLSQMSYSFSTPMGKRIETERVMPTYVQATNVATEVQMSSTDVPVNVFTL